MSVTKTPIVIKLKNSNFDKTQNRQVKKDGFKKLDQTCKLNETGHIRGILIQTETSSKLKCP